MNAVLEAGLSVATLVVVAATALAALVQLRHMRATNELEAILAVQADFHTPAVQDALSYVALALPGRLGDAAYRAELSRRGYVDPGAHPEMVLCNWFNRAGTLVRGGFINERLFMASFGRLVEHYWVALGPVVALLRRERGDDQYDGFESLAYRARRFGTRRPLPASRRARRPIPDPWLDAET